MVAVSFIFTFITCAHLLNGHVANAFFFGEPNWNTLRVTWGLNLFRKHVFERMPLTEQEALDEGYAKINSQCTGKFLGSRYMILSNTSLVLLYDVNGRIAGIQSGFPKSMIYPASNKEWFENSPILIDDNLNGVETYTATAYFVDPETICTRGRTREEFTKNPSGNKLSVQRGSDPLRDLIKIPNYEDDIEMMAVWTKGKCFPSMGTHYWYNITRDMNCDNFLPMFLLYNRRALTGFGWAVPNMYDFDRYEHPPKNAFSKFFNTVPLCLNSMFDKAQGFSTMHVYMNDKPWNLFC